MTTGRTADDTQVSRRVGQNIRRIRTARGLSGRALAELLRRAGRRSDATMLSHMERGTNSKGGQRAITVDDLVAIADALTDRTRSTTTDRYENRWDPVSSTEWQLMTRRKGTRRYSWTHRSIHSVPQLPAP